MQHLIQKLNVQEVSLALRNCLGQDRKKVALHEPLFAGREWEYVKECLDSGWVSSAGEFVDRFEKDLAEYTGAKFAIAVVNGTSALHIALKLSGVGEGDEVLVPDLTFVAPANAVTYCRATPHFVDSEEKTLGVDPSKLGGWLRETGEWRTGGGLHNRQTGRPIQALLVMHTFGHPVDLDSLVELCDRFKLILIEDASEALGTFYKGVHVGNRGKFSVLSFNGNKTITTGGGGAILTNDKEQARLAKHLTTTAKLPHPWQSIHDQVGYNYRLPNINAALGCAQLEQLPSFLERKRRLAMRYQEAFSKLSGLRFFTEPEFAKSNYWLHTLLLDEDQASERDPLIRFLHDCGIEARPPWTLMHKLPMFQTSPKMDVNTAKSLESRLINIPSSAFL